VVSPFLTLRQNLNVASSAASAGHFAVTDSGCYDAQV
jgi:hypothetical protein